MEAKFVAPPGIEVLGKSVGIDQDVVIGGAPGGSGSAFAFRFNGSFWVQEAGRRSFRRR
jgi:hypothetical protein